MGQYLLHTISSFNEHTTPPCALSPPLEERGDSAQVAFSQIKGGRGWVSIFFIPSAHLMNTQQRPARSPRPSRGGDGGGVCNFTHSKPFIPIPSHSFPFQAILFPFRVALFHSKSFYVPPFPLNASKPSIYIIYIKCSRAYIYIFPLVLLVLQLFATRKNAFCRVCPKMARLSERPSSFFRKIFLCQRKSFYLCNVKRNKAQVGHRQTLLPATTTKKKINKKNNNH